MRRFNAIVDRYRHRVYSLAFYSLGSREEAEDITQEVFIKLWEHWTRIETERAMAWLTRVTRNACLDIHRARRLHTALLDQNDPAATTVGRASSAADPQVNLERRDFRDRVRVALKEIEEPYRSIVIMREIQDLPYNQIAEALEMPLNTVKVYLHRGRRMLRERLIAPLSSSEKESARDAL